MARTVTLVMDLPPSKNSEPNSHWRSRQKCKERWAVHGWCAWVTTKDRPKFKKVSITPHFYVWALRDEDNLFGLAFKGIIDGLKGNLMPDDKPEHMTLEKPVQVVDRQHQRLELFYNGILENKRVRQGQT